MRKIIKSIVKAHESETVEIRWYCDDGKIHIRRFTIPPRAVLNYHEEEE